MIYKLHDLAVAVDMVTSYNCRGARKPLLSKLYTIIIVDNASKWPKRGNNHNNPIKIKEKRLKTV